MSLPDKIFGISTEEAYKLVINEKDNPENEGKKDSNKKTKSKNKSTSTQKVNLSDYILLPKHDIYVAKEVTLKGSDWYDSHKEAHKQKARMLTLREFVDFLLLLKSGDAKDGLGNKLSDSEVTKIDLDITEQRDPYRGEWLDSDFKIVKANLNINYNHKTVGKKLVPENSEPLETCLMEDCKIDLTSFNKQGLPIKKGNDFSYGFPRSDNNSVAWFNAGAGRVGLYCNGDPQGSDGGLGVRLVREKT